MAAVISSEPRPAANSNEAAAHGRVPSGSGHSASSSSHSFQPQQSPKSSLRSSTSRKNMSITLDPKETSNSNNGPDRLDTLGLPQDWPGTPGFKGASGPPPSPSAIHPSFGLEHASKNVATAYSGPRSSGAPGGGGSQMQPSSEPLSPTASSSSTDAPDMESNPSDQGAHAAPFTSARHHPLNTSISRANKDTSSATASTSAPRAFKEKNRKTSLPRPFFQPSSSSFASRFEGSPLGDALSYFNTPAMAKVFDSSTAWILYYFVLNLGLTLYNKLVLVKFPFPFTVTGIHCLCGAAGCYILKQQGAFTQSSLSRREYMVLISFSFLYTINISLSNISLRLVTVPFHQVVRATTPIFTIMLNYMFLGKQSAPEVYISLIPVVAGVGLATYGDYYYTFLGFFLTTAGAFLAAVKGIATNTLLVGRLRLHPLDLLYRMSPLAFAQCVVYAWAGGELTAVREYSATKMTRANFLGLLFNGVLAFGLNVVSFSANKKTSALTMTVAANVKQVLTILWAVWLFDVSLNFTNSLGIFLTLVGGGAYAFANHITKRDLRKARDSNAGLSPQLEVDMSQNEKR